MTFEESDADKKGKKQWRDWTLSGPWLLGLEREEEMMIDARFDLLYLGNNIFTFLRIQFRFNV